MLLTLLWFLIKQLLNALIQLWNLLPLGPSWKIKPIGKPASPASPASDEAGNANRPKGKVQEDDGLTREERKKQYLWLLRLLVALAIPVILETLDYTVVATAQPRIASVFRRLDMQSYIGTIYLLTATVFMPLFASLSDVYGRHFAMQLSLIFFTIGSAISTGAQNMPMMLAGRGVAGIGAAGMLTILRTILADSRSLNLNNLQGAIMTILYTVGFCIGPVIGGALTDISFRWVFAINLPAAVVSMILIFILLRKHTRRPLHGQNLSQTDKLLHIDWTATIFFTIGGICVLLGLNWGSAGGWGTVKVIVCLAVGVVLIGATIVWEFVLEQKQSTTRMYRRDDLEGVHSDDGVGANGEKRAHLAPIFRATALLPLSVMSHFDVMATNFAAFTSGMVMLVVFYFVALFFTIVSGQSATNAGVQLLYFAPGLGIGTVVSIRMVKILRQPKYPILLGGTIITISLGLISMAIDHNNEGQIKGFMVMAGTGVGMTFGPLAIHARFSQPTERVAIVSALNLFFRSLGGTVGLAQCGTVTNAKVQDYFNSLPPSVRAELPGSTSFNVGDLTSIDQIESLPADAQELVRNAFRNALRWSFISLIPWAGVSLFVCLFLRKIQDPDATRRIAQDSVPEPTAPGSAKTPLKTEESRDWVKEESRGTSSLRSEVSLK